MRTRIILLLLICPLARLLAQSKAENVRVLEEFMSVCRSYQQAPMHAQLSIQTRSNVPATIDTTTKEADFYMLPAGTYIHMGELEELMSDSQALIISHDIRQMVLYTDASPIIARTRQLLSLGMDRDKLRQLESTCRVNRTAVDGGRSLIQVSSLNMLGNGQLAADSIAVEYDAASKEPYRIEQWSRSLFAVDSAAYNSLAKSAEWQGRLFRLKDGFYAIREQVTRFVYRKIEHGSRLAMPASIGDRIARKPAGGYEPLPAYTNYLLTEN